MRRLLNKILFCWFIGSEILPNILLSFTEPLTLFGRMANIILPLGIIGLIAAISKQIGRTVLLMFPYTFFAAFQIVCLSLYGYGIISVDMLLNVLTTNDSEVFELLARLWPILLLIVFVYLIPIILGAYCIYTGKSLSERFLRHNRKIWGSMTILGIICLVGCYIENNGYDVRKDLYPVNVGYNLYLTSIRWEETKRYPETSAEYRYDAVSVHDKEIEENYIVVIGETARADNWEILGYGRSTNPSLSERKDLIVAKNAYSESNTTHKSVPMLLSNVDALTFGTELKKVKSLITAFKEAGFHTSFISNQMPNHSYIDYFGSEADTTVFVKKMPGKTEVTGDDIIIPYVKNLLDSDCKKRLIVLHTYGSHFDYRDRYSEQDKRFLPDNFNKASKAYRSELINAYDNSIVATDRLLNTFIEMMEERHSVGGMFYCSDHGEDIFDDGISFLHASPRPTKFQLHVPFITWLSPEYVELYPETASTLRANSEKLLSTSRTFCPTIMSIGGIKSERIRSCDDLTSPDFRTMTLYYLNDHNIPVMPQFPRSRRPFHES